MATKKNAAPKPPQNPAPTAADELPAEKPAPVADQLAAAERRIAELESALAAKNTGNLDAADAQLVAAKIRAGLDRDQAIEVVKRQKAHDAALAEAAKK